ncbi:MAG: hypothetical protein WCT01_03170 [Candidatus Shapirobacteria bacterium]
MSRIHLLTVILLVAINTLGVSYLMLPTPTLPPLQDSIRSQEPGDTVQLQNVTAYYSNLTRAQVLNFYKAYYSGPFRIIINHPPETARQLIKDTIQTYYLYEILLPYRETLYINGYEWQNDVFTEPSDRIKNKLIYEGKTYSTKITLKSFPTTPTRRLVNFFGLEIIFILLFIIYRRIYAR